MISPNSSIKNNKSQGDFSDLKVALVHDFLTDWGGAEKVLEVLAEMFPRAPIYTLLYDEEKMRGRFTDRKIYTSFLQKFPRFWRKRKKYLLPFLPISPETFDLRDFDVVISSSGAWSKGIVTRLNTIHIAYLHSPMRFAWDYNERYWRSISKKPGILGRACLNYLRLWDFQAAKRPDYLIANSFYTAERIAKYYRRKSVVIYPPAGIKFFQDSIHQSTDKSKISKNVNFQSPISNYFLIVSRLSPYKRIDLAVEAFNKLELPLLVIGTGEQEKYLKKIAGKTVRILGWQDPEKLEQYYVNARALVFPAEDDFGLVMVEAMSKGVPVIAYGKGGAREIVREGITGEFFHAQTVEVLADGVMRFLEKENKYDRKVIQQEARKFSQEKFQTEFFAFLKKVLEKNKR